MNLHKAYVESEVATILALIPVLATGCPAFYLACMESQTKNTWRWVDSETLRGLIGSSCRVQHNYNGEDISDEGLLKFVFCELERSRANFRSSC